MTEPGDMTICPQFESGDTRPVPYGETRNHVPELRTEYHVPYLLLLLDESGAGNDLEIAVLDPDGEELKAPLAADEEDL